MGDDSEVRGEGGEVAEKIKTFASFFCIVMEFLKNPLAPRVVRCHTRGQRRRQRKSMMYINKNPICDPKHEASV